MSQSSKTCEPGVIFAPARHIESVDDCYFYHTMELPGFGVVKGQWDLRGKFDDYIGHVDVRGKSVLDIGTANGFLSFEAERRGASRVVSFDMSDVRQQSFVPFGNKEPARDSESFLTEYGKWIDRWKNGYWLCHRLFQSRAEVFYGDVHELPLELGTFDVTIVGSVLEHLRDPVRALQSIIRLTGKTLILVTPVLDNEEPIARFAPRQSDPEHDYTWWIYSIGLYRELLGILGFTISRVTTAEYRYEHEQRAAPLTTLVAQRR